MRSTAFVLFLLASLSSAAAGQTRDTLPLSLETAVDRTLSSGDEILLAAAQYELAEAQLTTARASALPQLRVTSNYTHVIEIARAQAVGQIFNSPIRTTAARTSRSPSFRAAAPLPACALRRACAVLPA